MLPFDSHAHLSALASAAYALLMDTATPCHLREKVLTFVKDLKAELPLNALKDVEAEEAKAIIEAANYFR